MGTNNKSSPTNERTYFNNSPNNKKNNSSGSQQQQFQRPTPSKSINIRTPPNKNHQAGLSSSSLSNPISSSTNITNSNKRLSGSCSPPNFSYFAGSKCFESPSPQSLPKPPTSWFNEGSKKKSSAGPARVNRVRKTLSMTSAEFFTRATPTSCAAELVMHQNTSFSSNISNDLCTQSLKLMLNVNAWRCDNKMTKTINAANNTTKESGKTWANPASLYFYINYQTILQDIQNCLDDKKKL